MSMGRTGFNDTVSTSWLDPTPLLGTRALTSPSASDWTIDTATQTTRSLDQWCTLTRPIRGNGTFLVNELGKYDDESSDAIVLPATWNFFGTSLTQVWVNNNGNVTSVSAIRTGYGATFAGQVQGYRWTADPTVQEQRVYLSNSYTDKYGTHNFYKGRSRLTGHWAICLAGPLNWACPVEHDAHTVDELGYGSTASGSEMFSM